MRFEHESTRACTTKATWSRSVGIRQVTSVAGAQGADVKRSAPGGTASLGSWVDEHISTPKEETMADESYTGTAYCVKCKEKRDFTGVVVEKNGRRMAQGICPVCNTKVNRILGKAS